MRDPTVLRQIENVFHSLIRLRAAQYIDKYALALPLLKPTPAGEVAVFRVPGMGYFSYQWQQTGAQWWLDVESRYTAISGSGQRHRVTAQGASLLEDGF
ncbi:hypothetical protein [Parvibium lacunae]|uniref:Uncharacterized protein n=1 Tax=Parvibium lacunae TaxID=1888893 RepID=A0A368L4U9_9BURK|nr:hypothetical protein [Parvibium lacunae]RCS58180.1 hypothetical protein DU000_04965 [Parvibium lacunae]